jgi:hypothetical protein
MSRTSGFVAAFIAAGVYALIFAAPLLAEDINGGSSEAAASARGASVLKVIPLGALSARGTGSITVTMGSCAGLTCNSGDSCNCFMATVPINASGLGKSTLALTLNNDLNSLGNNGSNGVCRLMSGIGVITVTSGDTLTFSITGDVCTVNETLPVGFDGNFSVSSGTGKLSTARGAGVLDFAFYTLGFSTSSIDLVMNGAFAK